MLVLNLTPVILFLGQISNLIAATNQNVLHRANHKTTMIVLQTSSCQKANSSSWAIEKYKT